MQVTFSTKPSCKIPMIKGIRAVLGLGLKEAKEAAECGFLTIEPIQIHDLEKAIRPFADKIIYTMPVSVDASVQRITGVGIRVAGRLLSKLASRLETIEAFLWKDVP